MQSIVCKIVHCTIYWALFSRQKQQYTNQLTHISLCIIEFISRTMSLHVSAHGAILRRYINNLTYLHTELSPSWEAANCAATQELPSILWNPKFHHRVHKSPYTIELCILYGSIYFFPFSLITVICTDCILYCVKSIKQVFKLIKGLKH
jgi:hypothetical protein